MNRILTLFATVLAISALTIYLSEARPASAKNDDLESAKQLSRAIMRDLAVRNSVADPDGFRITTAEVDAKGFSHVRFLQTFGEVSVWGGEAIVHLKPGGEVFKVTNDLRSSIAVDTKPALDADAAIAAAKGFYQGSAFLTAEPTADLWIYRGEDRDHLAYRVRMRREDGTEHTSMPVIFVDAHTGEKVFGYDNLQTGVGTSLYSGNDVQIGTLNFNSAYYMEDIGRRLGTFDAGGTTSSVFRFVDANDIWTSNAQRAAVDAHYGSTKFYDYFLNVHGRNGINGDGGPAAYLSVDGVTPLISARVHYSRNYNNAFWNGSLVTYGDGDGTNFSPLVSLDICAHEMMHGITEQTAGLTYQGESGALNESMSDVFGALVERYARGENTNTWRIAEDAYTPGNGTGDAFRYLDNPHSAANSGFTADDDPDHYSERYQGSGDNGGVHVNSGIGNKAFYLLAIGGTHHRGITVTGIGADDAGEIWWEALRFYMTTTTNYAGAREATLNAAEALYGIGSPQYSSVAAAWCAVGVGTCVPPAGIIDNGGFESTLRPWMNQGGTYTANGPVPHSGTGYFTLGGAAGTTHRVWQDVVMPAEGASTLSLWLNINSNETSRARVDVISIEIRDTAGNLLSTLGTFSNLDRTSGGGYTLRTFSVSAYAGQTIRLQFRALNNSSQPTTFRVDDVAIN